MIPAAEGVDVSGVQLSNSGFLPYASKLQDVAELLIEHIARLLGSSIDRVRHSYESLEPGFHLVFKRELCLKHDKLTLNDHKGRRAIQLIGHEKLVQAVADPSDALEILARLLEKGRVETVKAARMAKKGQHATDPLVMDVSNLITQAELSSQHDIDLRSNDQGMVASWKDPPHISLEGLQEITSLRDLHCHQNLALKQPMEFCTFMGGGGGSDVIQAAALAKLFTKANRIMRVPAVVSIRALLSKSTSAGERRSVWHEDDPKCNLLESSKGDLKIEPHHHGNARFVEDAIVDDFDNVRLVVDDETHDEQRRNRYEGALGENVDSIIVVDTGGDVLGGIDSHASKRAPDQDRRTQLATAQIAAANNLNAIVAIAAVGVDAPPDAQRKLEASDAVYYRFTEGDKKYLKGLYSKWHFNGTPENLKKHPEHYGKTPLAMLASFDLQPGQRGSFRALPLPESVINDFDNPWACITWIAPEMSCLILINQAKLLSVIAPQGKD
ncbi:hypothetical protein GJ744_010286 [Endocarpon pusillum]|uniref:Uncharacterized protein n=1 Tax=Endocarpon pusillum TaxID=364733 RepID=A0A8H7AI98_9EURO|nr:hypothetical protein GJ744_010286 [Endocarpon pusillum]